MNIAKIEDFDKLDNALTVQELIDLLSDVPEDRRDAKVVVRHDYGDISHTQELLPIRDSHAFDPLYDDCAVVSTAYSASGLAIETFDEETMEAMDQAGVDAIGDLEDHPFLFILQ